MAVILMVPVRSRELEGSVFWTDEAGLGRMQDRVHRKTDSDNDRLLLFRLDERAGEDGSE